MNRQTCGRYAATAANTGLQHPGALGQSQRDPDPKSARTRHTLTSAKRPNAIPCVESSRPAHEGYSRVAGCRMPQVSSTRSLLSPRARKRVLGHDGYKTTTRKNGSSWTNLPIKVTMPCARRRDRKADPALLSNHQLPLPTTKYHYQPPTSGLQMRPHGLPSCPSSSSRRRRRRRPPPGI
jgi:hypothetical protein